MERQCKLCNQIKNTPYKDICRSCYQKKWVKNIQEKTCRNCKKIFQTAGKKCWSCLKGSRSEKYKNISCINCHRIGLVLVNMKQKICITCNRQKKEIEDPSRKEIRRKQERDCSRRKRGIDLNAPVRKSNGWWINSQGYKLLYKPKHPNVTANGGILEHVFVMSEYLGRPLIKGETVHHINGVRDDNRLENLELWSNSHPAGQRIIDKIQWAKKILEMYDESKF